MFYTILTASRSPAIGSGLTYEAGETHLQAGTPVRVPLRKAIVDGIVLDVHKQKLEQDIDLRSVHAVLGDAPLLLPPQLKTMQWMAEYYCCTLRQALGAWLPAPPWQQLLPKEIISYSLSDPDAELRGRKQVAVADYLRGRGHVELSELKAGTEASPATLRSLLERGVIAEHTHREGRQPASDCNIQRPVLTDEQQEVYEAIKKEARPSLIFGVTGSGKTEIYAQLMADVIEQGKQAILLVPEILLTEHCIHRFEALVGREHIAVLHSRLTASQRRAEWRRIRYSGVPLVIGSRSALFAPVQNLGLVVIDEEHEWTYKNEQTPRYHARETAEKLCEFAGAKLVLGTATPSLESWARTKDHQLHLTRLPHRYNHTPLPSVRIIDLADVQFGQCYPFSPPLLEAIEERLRRGEQSVLFLNRRGIATALLCLDCRRRVVSPDSQLPFTVHHTGQRVPYLADHTTGLTVDVPDRCPSCGSARLQAVGAGTQRVEDILTRLFPSARLLRADRDTLRHPEQMRLLLKKMRERNADILLGTQSVVKGLDLPGVTLAAVLLADVGLSLPHFRAGERIFQLLTQLTGRSGRTQPGGVIIQTFRPDAPEVRLAAEHDTETYLEQELKLRTHAGYPPATEMIRLLLRGPQPAARAAELLKELKQRITQQGHNATVSAAPTLFGGGRVWHVLLRGSGLRELMKDLPLYDVVVDVDPVDCV